MATKQYNTNRRTESTGLMNIIKNLISGKTNDQRRPQRVSQKTIDNMDDLKQNLHPTNIGRALGRKTAGMFMDMFKSDDKKDNVKGRKGRAKETKENKTNNPLYTKVSEGADKPVRKNDTLSDVFSKIYNLLKINTEDNRKKYQLEKNFGEEKEDEREKRHLELLKAISGLTGGGTVTQVVGEKKGDLFGNLLNSVKGMIENFKKLLGPLLEFAKDVGKNGLKMLGKLANLLTGSKLLSVLGKISMGLSLALFSSDLNANEAEDLAAKQELGPTITPGVRKQFSRGEIEQFVKHKEWFNNDKLKNREAGFPGADRETLQQWLTDNPNPKSLYMPDEKRNVQKSVDRSVSRIQAQSKQNGSNDAGSTSTATPTLSPKAITASPLPGSSSSSTSPSYFNEPSESSKRYQSAFQNQFQQEGMGVGKRSIMFNNPTTVVTGDTKVQSIDVEESAPVRIDDPTLKHIQERNLRRF
jgi:hypothetical protein